MLDVCPGVVVKASQLKYTISKALLITVVVMLGSGCGQSKNETHQVPGPPVSAKSAQPHLQNLPDGAPLLSWQEQTAEGTTLKASIYRNHQWQPARTVAHGTNWFVNWADFPSITPISESVWAAHWLQKNGPGSYAYDVAIAFTENAGASWSKATIPHNDGTETEHGFVSLYPMGDAIGAIWLDGREMANTDHAADHSHANHAGGGMTLRSAVIRTDGSQSHEQQIDGLVCECCQTDVAVSAVGPIAVYRNRSEHEVRDIYYSRFINQHWSEGKAVSADQWVVEGCPVNGPAIAAANELVAVAWYTEANQQPRVRLAISRDAGSSFSNAIDLDNEQPIGRVDVVALTGNRVFASWIRRAQGDRGELVLQAVVNGEPQSSPTVIAQADISRPGGFPQMIEHNGSLLFAWTEPDDSGSRVKTTLIPLADLL
jgi:hypothetical protein